MMWGEGLSRAKFRVHPNHPHAMKSTTPPCLLISATRFGFFKHSEPRGNFLASAYLALLAAGLAGGWILRGTVSAPVTAATPTPPVAVTARPAPVIAPIGNLAQAWGISSSGKPAHTLPRPFHSLEEIANALGECDIFSSELGIVEILTTLPRLLTTDLPATRRILDELNHAATPQGDARGIIAGMLLGRWMIQEPETALRYLQANPELAGSGRNANDFFKGMSGYGTIMVALRDPAAAHKLLAELLPEDQRKDPQQLLDMCEALSDPARALASMPPDKLDQAGDLAGVWARRDPTAAARWVDSLVEVNDSIVKKVAVTWAARDQAAAIAWVAGLTSDSARAAAFDAIATSLTAGKEFQQAVEALKAMPAAAADIAILRCAAYRSGKDRAAELQIVGEILDRHSGDQAMQEAGSFAACNLTQWLAENKGMATAVTWMMTLPDGDARNAAAGRLSSQWTSKDAAAASEWVTSLPQGDLRSSAISGLVDTISEADPERALAWAQALPPGKGRTAQIAQVMHGWLPKDPYAAMQAVESLPEELRAEIWKDAEK